VVQLGLGYAVLPLCFVVSILPMALQYYCPLQC